MPDEHLVNSGNKELPDSKTASSHDHHFNATLPLDATEDVGETPRVPGFIELQEIGRGGMGRVYRAREVDLDRDVAVKILHVRYKDQEDSIARFKDEARITGQLQHPGIPAVHRVGTLADGRPYLAMKLIKGNTLQSLLKARVDVMSDQGRFLAAFEQVCQAVGYAHAHRVLHRDLKPQNVMVGAFGEVQVMDWGLAKILPKVKHEKELDERVVSDLDETRIIGAGERDSETQTGSVLGTPAYMPPEQAGGENARVDERSDVFGLGAILCVILTGQPPFTGQDVAAVRLAAIRGSVTDAFARLDACGAQSELVELAKKCLSPEQSSRPINGAEVAQIVADLRAGAEQRARQAELAHATEIVQSAEERKRRRVQFALASIVLTFLLVTAAAIGWYREDQAKTALASERARADQQLQHVRERDKVRQEQAASSIALAYQLLDKSLFAEAATTLASAEALAGTAAGTDVHTQLERAKTDVAMATRLDRARIAIRFEEFSDRVGEKEFLRAFTDFGFDLEHGDLEDLQTRLRESPIHSHLLNALDDWMLSIPPLATRVRLWLITAGVGDESWRPKLATHWVSADLVRRLLEDTPREQRTPALYGFVTRTLETVFGEDALKIIYDGCVQHPKDYWLHVDYSGFNRRRGHYEAAAHAIRAAISLRPEVGTAWAVLASNHLSNNNVDLAIDAAYEAIKRDENSPFSHIILARTLRAKGDLDGALMSVKRAAKLQPTSGDNNSLLGDLEFERGNYQAAATALRMADPGKNSSRQQKLGLALFACGEWEKAEAVFQDLIKLNPQSHLAYFYVGFLRRLAGDRDGATKVFTVHQTDLLPSMEDKAFSDVVIRHNAFDTTIDVWEAACRCAPDDPLLSFTLGVLYAQKADSPDGSAEDKNRLYVRAAEVLKKSDEQGRKRSHWPYPTAHWLAATLMYLERYEDIVRLVRMDGPEVPSLENCNLLYGWASMATANWEEAEQAFRRASDQVASPQLKKTLQFQIGMLLRRKGDRAGAIQLFLESSGQNSMNPLEEDDVFCRLLALPEVQAVPRAISVLTHSLKINPKEPYLQLLLGRLYLSNGNYAAAADAFERAEEMGRHLDQWPYQTAALARNVRLELDSDSFLNFERPCQNVDDAGAIGSFLAHRKRRYLAAARFTVAVLDQHPEWNSWSDSEPAVRLRYLAAAYFVKAANGEGDAASLDADERTQLRRQANDWLRAELQLALQNSAVDPQRSARIRAILKYGQIDGWMATVRDPIHLDKLPVEERQIWQKFWEDWAAALTQTDQAAHAP